LNLLSTIAGSIDCGTGDVIVQAGSASDELYLILNGEVDILIESEEYGRKSGSPPITITTLRRGQSFGEMALVSEGIRAATARCAQHDTSLIVFRRTELMQLFDQYPRLGYRMMYNLAADLAMKIRATDLRIQERVTWSDIR
jgi:CRP-like cAMP-binding protein